MQDNTYPPIACSARDLSGLLADVRGVSGATVYVLIVERKRCLSGHTTTKGISRVRVGKECKPLFATTDDDRTKVVVPGATLEHLAVTSIQWAMVRHGQRFQNPESFANTEDFLTRAGLLRCEGECSGDQITLAALLLFGKDAALARLAPFCETIVSAPSSNRTLRKNIIESFRELVVADRSTLRTTCPEVPEATLRELLINAYVHRCWRSSGPVVITISDTSVDIQNLEISCPVSRSVPCCMGCQSTATSSWPRECAFQGWPIESAKGLTSYSGTVLAGGFDFPVFGSANNTFRASIPLARSDEFREFVRRRGGSLSQLDELVALRYLWGVGEANFKQLSDVLQRGKEIARRVVHAMESKLMIEVDGGAFRLSEAYAPISETSSRWISSLSICRREGLRQIVVARPRTKHRSCGTGTRYAKFGSGIHSMLRATRREMERAHRHYREHCGSGGSPHLALLLFYSVECGLKVLLMIDRRVEAYEDLPETHKINHDLALALTLLHAPPEVHAIARLKMETRHRKPPNERVAPKDLHQAFRYGIDISPHDEAIAFLQDILHWLQERIR